MARRPKCRADTHPSTTHSTHLRKEAHAPPQACDPGDTAARTGLLFRHAHGIRLHHAVRLPERHGRLLAGAVLRHQPGQPGSTQPFFPLSAHLPGTRHQHEPVGRRKEAGHGRVTADFAGHRPANRTRKIFRRIGNLLGGIVILPKSRSGALVAGEPASRPMFCTYLGYWLMGAALLTVGMLASALTDNLTVAFILGAVFCSVPVFLNYAGSIVIGAH